jgi:glucans biosynthesis protein C
MPDKSQQHATQGNTTALTLRKRTFYLDNFRSFLTALVIYHHTAIAYGGIGNVFYRSKQHPDDYLPLVAFNVINQSFFMGSFFFLSGYFMSVSVQKKSPTQIWQDRFYRIGVPMMVYTIVSEPLLHVTKDALLESRFAGWKNIFDNIKNIRGIRGPVWYSAVVLMFDSACLLIQSLKLNEITPIFKAWGKYLRPLDTSYLITIILLTALSSFLIRIRYPIGGPITLLHLELGFLPQYIFYYTLGHLVSHPLNPSEITPPYLLTYLLSISVLSISAAIASLRLDDRPFQFSTAAGGINPMAACYAVLNETVGYLLFSSSLKIFYNNFNFQLPWNIPRYAYSAFLVHRPLQEAIEELTDHVFGHAVLKTAVIGTLSVIGSWVCGALLLRVNGIRQFLG